MSQTGDEGQMPGDTLNEIGVLTRREIEARIAGPLIHAMSREFGRERVIEIVRDVITRIAKEQGKQLAEALGGGTLAHFARARDAWQKGNALESVPLEESEHRLSYNVTRCRYAELYRALGIPELGFLLSCQRDFALMEGFNPAIKLTRTQTIMEGAPHCDFRFVADEPSAGVAIEDCQSAS